MGRVSFACVLIAGRAERGRAIFKEMDFVDPHSTLLKLGLKEGMKVGDFGCGSGHYALAASAMVGPSGRVYAVDVQEDMLKRLKDDAERRGARNIDFVWGDIERAGGTKLKEGAMDAVILSNTCFQLDDKEGAVEETKRVLKAGGLALLVEWTGAHGGMGPSKERVVLPRDAEALFVEGGFEKVKDFSAGPHHYAVIFRKA
jgi:ubiquinone/menaquinone biosynthesis C-methylase UbiE